MRRKTDILEIPIVPPLHGVYSSPVQATITQLRRKTTKSVRRVNHGRRKVTIVKTDRAAALALLRSIGPVPLPSRK